MTTNHISLIDRLSHEACTSLHISIQKNLENLLNTRQSPLQADTPLITYGIPHLTDIYLQNEEKQKEFCLTLKKIIQRFEPRLKTVEVNLLNNKLSNNTLPIRITGVVHPENIITLDSSLEPTTQTFAVSKCTLEQG